MVAAPPDRFREMFQGMGQRLQSAPGRHRRHQDLPCAAPDRHRKLVNYEAIEAIAVSEGYRIVHLEDFDSTSSSGWCACGARGRSRGIGVFPGFLRPARNARGHPEPSAHGIPDRRNRAAGTSGGCGCTVVTGPFHRIEEGGYTHHSDYEIDPDGFAASCAHGNRRLRVELCA